MFVLDLFAAILQMVFYDTVYSSNHTKCNRFPVQIQTFRSKICKNVGSLKLTKAFACIEKRKL